MRKVAFSVLGVLFLLFAYFQLNDPDSFKWIFYYLLIAGLCFMTGFKVGKLIYIYMMLAVSLIWMFTLFPDAVAWVRDGMPSIVESMKAETQYVELVREFLGLLISSVVLVVMLVVERRAGT